MKDRKTLIFAEGYFGGPVSKTAVSVIRYLPEEVIGVVDSGCSGKTVNEVLGFGGDIPVIGNMDEGLKLKPDNLLIGIAPRGGELPSEWVPVIERALEKGVSVTSGLHTYLSEIERFAGAAKRGGTHIRDLRMPSSDIGLPGYTAYDWKGKVILTVGTDGHTGKMTASLELVKGLKERGINAVMAATGQTGIYIRGEGIPIDAVKSDFIAGAAEKLVLDNIKDGVEAIVVEGQGGLGHPAYSGVTAGLIHGAKPDAMILCHQPGRRFIAGYEDIAIPDYRTLINIHEDFAALVKPAPVIGIALDCHELSSDETKAAIKKVQEETSLPATDSLRFGVTQLVRPIEELSYLI